MASLAPRMNGKDELHLLIMPHPADCMTLVRRTNIICPCLEKGTQIFTYSHIHLIFFIFHKKCVICLDRQASTL